jgi:hypothetical protein
MLRRLKRYFWWLVGVVCLWTAIWFFYKGSEIDKQWDEQMGQTEGNWKEIDKQLLELLTAHKQAESNREKSRLEGELINLQTKHFTLQREALKKTQGLYYERCNYSDLYCVLTILGCIFTSVGTYRSGLMWKRKCLAIQGSYRAESLRE